MPTTRKLHLPDPLGIVRPLSDLELSLSANVFHPVFKSPQDCPVCKNTQEFRFYAYASVEWQRKVASLSEGEKGPDPFAVRLYACDCRAQWIAHRVLAICGLTMSYQTFTRFDLSSAQPLGIYTNFSENLDANLALGIGLVLVGTYGVGKTLVASLLVKDAMRMGHTAFMATFPRLISLYQATWDNRDVQRWWDKRVKNAALLVVDDIGKETKTGAKESTNLTRGLLDDLIRYRVGAHLSTLVTTNVTPDLFAASYGESIASLWGESSEIIHVLGQDRRPDQQRQRVNEYRAGIVRPVMV